jgi:hypothetical protein
MRIYSKPLLSEHDICISTVPLYSSCVVTMPSSSISMLYLLPMVVTNSSADDSALAAKPLMMSGQCRLAGAPVLCVVWRASRLGAETYCTRG